MEGLDERLVQYRLIPVLPSRGLNHRRLNIFLLLVRNLLSMTGIAYRTASSRVENSGVVSNLLFLFFWSNAFIKRLWLFWSTVYFLFKALFFVKTFFLRQNFIFCSKLFFFVKNLFFGQNFLSSSKLSFFAKTLFLWSIFRFSTKLFWKFLVGNFRPFWSAT